jgi:hypothetical protein
MSGNESDARASDLESGRAGYGPATVPAKAQLQEQHRGVNVFARDGMAAQKCADSQSRLLTDFLADATWHKVRFLQMEPTTVNRTMMSYTVE